MGRSKLVRLTDLHLDDNTASEFVSGTLASGRLTVVERHLATCRDCRAHVAALAGTDVDDSQAKTRPHDKGNESSQVSARPTRTFTVGDRVGRYLVLSTLGTGGMGVVFAAYDPQLDRKVALKLLRAGLGVTTKEARTRLRREAQAIAQLSHPNVVGVYDVGATDDGDLYIAMEFVEGDTLTTWLKRWPRTWRDIVDVYLQAARGLYAAHSVGLLHRDFKPDNVLVGSDGRVRVTDFGLARSVMTPEEGTRPKPEMAALSVELTVTGTVLGTPRYMPPEQLSSPQIDARSDQFSFCVALYEALYEKHPLTGATAISMLEAGDKASPPPEGTKVPGPIGRAVLRGLDADRAKRFPTMAALMGELSPRPGRSPVRLAAFVIAGVVVLGGATAAMMTRPQTRAIAPIDNTSAQALIEELNKVNSERNRLFTQLKEAQKKTKDEIEHLKQQLVEKDRQIQVLVEEVAKIQQPVTVKTKVTKPNPSQTFQVINAVFNSQSDVDGCFDEWAERITSYASTGQGKKPPTEANLIVRFLVAATGEGQSASATGGDDEAVLQPCVALAMERIKYPPGPEQLDVEVAVSWSEGQVILSPRVVGHHAPPKGTLNDL